ncbi:MAG: hypothetical protein LC792_18315 [Actinobacteria bacterium]|nr:hypothetical protein [Actinomycetota bacterium]
MSSIELQEVRDKAEWALKEVEADTGASPVLVAVVREFATKSAKAIGLAGGDREWEAVIELEQAGDSAKAAAEADAGAKEAARSSVLAAHLAICMLKAGMSPTVG